MKPLGYEKIKDKRVVLLQSGGLDSNILASIFNYFGFEIHHIFIDYGQNMVNKEREYAKKISKHYGGTFSEVTLVLPWLKNTTNLVDNEVKDGMIENTPLNTIDTGVYVPLRNHVLLSVAGSYAEAYEIPYIACGFDGSQDLLGNPTGGTTDKHTKFVKSITKSMNEGSSMKHFSNKKFEILTPVMNLYKPEIIGIGIASEADMSLSWSCYNSGELPCGKCSACTLRADAFKKVEIKDPAICIK